MIPAQNIVAWGNVVPWSDQRQVEQDLIIGRALVEIFSDDMLYAAVRVRGGTALNKLHFPKPMRYSEDFDLVRTSGGPIGPILDHLRVVLEPWLGRARFDQSPVAPKFRFRVGAEDGSGVPIRLKVEINTRETRAFDGPASLPLKIDNPWFSGEAAISTFSREEMLATKLRALLQRDQGRDLYDLRTRWRSSRISISPVWSRCLGGISTFPARGFPGLRPRSGCSPNWPTRASCSTCAPCYRLLRRKL